MDKASSKNKKFKGLGGWLIFLQIFFFWLLIESIYRIIFNLQGSLFQLVLIFLLIVSLIFMYKKKKQFLKWGDFTLKFIILIPILGSLFLEGVLTNNQIFSFVMVAIIALSLLIYLKKSERVKNTFIK